MMAFEIRGIRIFSGVLKNKKHPTKPTSDSHNCALCFYKIATCGREMIEKDDQTTGTFLSSQCAAKIHRLLFFSTDLMFVHVCNLLFENFTFKLAPNYFQTCHRKIWTLCVRQFYSQRWHKKWRPHAYENLTGQKLVLFISSRSYLSSRVARNVDRRQALFEVRLIKKCSEKCTPASSVFLHRSFEELPWFQDSAATQTSFFWV